MENNRENRDEREYRYILDKGNVQIKEIGYIAKYKRYRRFIRNWKGQGRRFNRRFRRMQR